MLMYVRSTLCNVTYCHTMLRNVLYYVFVRFCIAIMYVHVCMYIDTMIYVRVGEYK